MKSEKIIVCSGPSGSGKSSLVDFVLKKEKKIGFAISATSRLPRKNEKNGIDYYFLSLNEFKKILDSCFEKEHLLIKIN